MRVGMIECFKVDIRNSGMEIDERFSVQIV